MSSKPKGGRAAKPLNCILFPITGLVGVGDTLYIDVLLSCPLGIAGELAPAATIITYDRLREDVRQAPVPETRAPPYAAFNEDYIKLLEIVQETSKSAHPHPWLDWEVQIREAIDERFPSKDSLDERTLALHALFGTTRSKDDGAIGGMNRSMFALLPTVFHGTMFRRARWSTVTSKESLQRAALAALDVLSAFRFLCEASLALQPTEHGTGRVGSLFMQNDTFLEMLALVHHRVQIVPEAEEFTTPGHLADVMGPLLAAVEEDSEKTLLEHLRAMNPPFHQVRGLLEVLARNRKCFHFFNARNP